MNDSKEELLEPRDCLECSLELKKCKTCMITLCMKCKHIYKKIFKSFSNPIHNLCLECKTSPVCYDHGVCADCMDKYPYHFIIDETVAIGNSIASYNPFDIIINLNYPFNNVKEWEVDISFEKGKMIIKCGIEDNEHPSFKDRMIQLFETVFDILKEELNARNTFPVILFHCYAGVSRSSTMAILFLSKILEMTPSEIYPFVKERRKCVRPNKLFREILGLKEDLF